MMLLRALVAVLGLALTGLIIYAITQSGSYANGGLHGNFWEQFGAVITLPWGQVAMADLYVGFVLFAIIIGIAERSWVSAAFWIAPLFLLGNIWAALWLAMRLPALATQLSRPDWPSS